MDSRTKDALAGAAVTLAAFGACLWFILAAGTPTPGELPGPRVPLLGIGLALSIVLHLVFVGIAAKRLGRSVLGWLLLTFFTFPLGSIVAGVLLLWFSEPPVADKGAPAR